MENIPESTCEQIIKTLRKEAELLIQDAEVILKKLKFNAEEVQKKDEKIEN